MSYEKLKEGIEKIKEIDGWDFLFLSYKHYTHYSKYSSNTFSIDSFETVKEVILEMTNSFHYKINKSYENILPYSESNSKNTIDKIEVNDPILAEQWTKVKESIKTSDECYNLKEITPNAFIFKGNYEVDGEQKHIYLISKSNPIKIFNKKRFRLFMPKDNTIKKVEKPFIQFPLTFDAIVFEDILYAINKNIEIIFDLERMHRVICNNSLNLIKDLDIIDNLDSYEKVVLSNRNPYYFQTLNKELLKNLKNPNIIDILINNYNIPYDSSKGKFDLSNEQNAELFTKIICDRTKKDIFNESLYEVPSSKKLTI